MNFTNDQIRQAVTLLPPEFQEALTGAFIADKMLDIGKRYELHVDAVGTLHQLALVSLLGLLPGQKLAGVLAQELSLAPEKAEEIVHAINTEVFDGIKAKIREGMIRKEEDGKPIDKKELLDEIEHPAPIGKPAAGAKPATPEPPANLPIEKHASPAPAATEPSPIPTWARPNPPASAAAAPTPATHAEAIAAIKNADPYREPIE